MGTNLLYAGVFNPGKKLHHVAVIFYCLYHKINIPLDIGIYKILSKDIHWLRSYLAACVINGSDSVTLQKKVALSFLMLNND